MIGPIIFFASFILMFVMIVIRGVELRGGKATFLSKMTERADGVIVEKAVVTKHAIVSWARKTFLSGFRIAVHAAGMLYGSLRSNFEKTKTRLSVAMRERRVVAAEARNVSIFLKDMLEHKSRFQADQ